MRGRLTWQDLYYDGKIDYEDGFCEDTQEIVKLDENHGWDDFEELAEEEFSDLWDDE